MERWEAYLAGHEDEQFGALFDFLRIASISALPEHAADLAHAADWVAEHLRFIGVPEVRLLPDGAAPGRLRPLACRRRQADRDALRPL